MIAAVGNSDLNDTGVDRKSMPLFLLPVDRRAIAAFYDSVVCSEPLPLTMSSKSRTSSPLSTSSSGGGSRRRQNSANGVDVYRCRRQRNNEAARRSRAKRRRLDDVMKQKLEELATENRQLRSQLQILRKQLDYVISRDSHAHQLSIDDSLSSEPTSVRSPSPSSSLLLDDAPNEPDRKSSDDVTDASELDCVITPSKRRRLLYRTGSSKRHCVINDTNSRDDMPPAVSELHRDFDDDDDDDESLLTPLNLSRNGLVDNS